MNANPTIKSLEEKIRQATSTLEALKEKKRFIIEDTNDIYETDAIRSEISKVYDYRSKCQQAVELLCYIQDKKITEDGLEDA